MKRRNLTASALCSIALVTAVTTGCMTDRDQRVNLDQIPAAAKTAIEQATTGGVIKAIEQEKEHGSMTYEVKYMVDGKRQEVKVTADGKVLKKECDKE